MTEQRYSPCFLRLALVLAVLPATAADSWWQVRSGRFEVVTNTNEATARRAMSVLQEVSGAFRAASASGGDLPLRLYVFRGERDFQPFRPSATARGFFQGGPERNAIALHWTSHEGPRIIAHEYVHSLLNHGLPSLPKWVEEGLAEFYSTIRREGDQLTVGTPIGPHLATLASTRLLSAAELLSIGVQSPYYNESGRVGIFYAQSWALLHMLNLDARYRAEFPRFVQRLAETASVEASFPEAFGKTLSEAISDLSAYVRIGTLPVVTLPGGDLAEAATWQATRLPALDAEIALAELAQRVGNDDYAEKIYQAALAKAADTPEVQAGLGALALGRKDHAAARKFLLRAIELNSRNGETYFEYAMLLRETGAPPEEVSRWLERATDVSPQYAEAHFLLGVQASEAGRLPEAISRLRRAAAILPRQPYFWHALAIAEHRRGDPAASRAAAQHALRAARTDQEIAMAQAALNLGSRTAAPPPASVAAKPSSPAQRGVLEQVDCLGRSARIHLRSGGKRYSFFIADPGEILLRQASSVTFTFRCGPQAPRALTVTYKPVVDVKLGTMGEVTSLLFSGEEPR